MTTLLARPPGVRDDLRARAAYAEGAGIFRIVPALVARPVSIEELATLMRWAREGGCSVTARGAGSGMAGGNVGEGLLLDLTALEGAPLAIDAANHRAWCGAAVTIDQLNAAARPAGLRMPIRPSSGRWATAGGVVATNASGAMSYQAGSVRPWVEGLSVMTAEGDVVSLRRGVPAPTGVPAFDRLAAIIPDVTRAGHLIREHFPLTRKNSAGYALDAFLASGDLIDLLIGSEGTLALVTEVTWRLEALPRHRATVRFLVDSLEQLPRILDRIDPVGAVAVELLDRTFLEFVDPAERSTAEAILLVDIEGDPSDVLERLDILEGIGRETGCPTTMARDEAEAERLWAIRHAASPRLAQLGDTRRSLQVIEDAAVPRHRLGSYIHGIRTITASHAVPAVIFGHAGDGHLHVNLIPDVTGAGWQERVRQVYDETMDLVLQLGGTPSGEHGDGRLRAGLLERCYGPEVLALFHRIKNAFDPWGILNPGVILGEGPPPWDRLKVDPPGTVPTDIEAALRTIERDGTYDTPRLRLADRSADGGPC